MGTENKEALVNGAELKELFESAKIDKEQQDMFVEIFEASVSVKAKELTEVATEELKDLHEAEVESLKEKMTEYGEYVVEETNRKLDEYLDYVVSEYIKENQLAITNGLKAEMFDTMVEGLRTVFVEHNIDLPEDKVDVMHELEDSLSEAESELNETKKEVVSLRKTIAESTKKEILSKATAGLADTQAERVVKLAEELVYDEKFSTKVQTIVESITTKQNVNENDQGNANLTYIPESEQKPTNSRMSLYTKAVTGK